MFGQPWGSGWPGERWRVNLPESSQSAGRLKYWSIPSPLLHPSVLREIGGEAFETG